MSTERMVEGEGEGIQLATDGWMALLEVAPGGGANDSFPSGQGRWIERFCDSLASSAPAAWLPAPLGTGLVSELPAFLERMWPNLFSESSSFRPYFTSTAHSLLNALPLLLSQESVLRRLDAYRATLGGRYPSARRRGRGLGEHFVRARQDLPQRDASTVALRQAAPSIPLDDVPREFPALLSSDAQPIWEEEPEFGGIFQDEEALALDELLSAGTERGEVEPPTLLAPVLGWLQPSESSGGERSSLSPFRAFSGSLPTLLSPILEVAERVGRRSPPEHRQGIVSAGHPEVRPGKAARGPSPLVVPRIREEGSAVGEPPTLLRPELMVGEDAGSITAPGSGVVGRSDIPELRQGAADNARRGRNVSAASGATPSSSSALAGLRGSERPRGVSAGPAPGTAPAAPSVSAPAVAPRAPSVLAAVKAPGSPLGRETSTGVEAASPSAPAAGDMASRQASVPPSEWAEAGVPVVIPEYSYGQPETIVAMGSPFAALDFGWETGRADAGGPGNYGQMSASPQQPALLSLYTEGAEDFGPLRRTFTPSRTEEASRRLPRVLQTMDGGAAEPSGLKPTGEVQVPFGRSAAGTDRGVLQTLSRFETETAGGDVLEPLVEAEAEKAGAARDVPVVMPATVSIPLESLPVDMMLAGAAQPDLELFGSLTPERMVRSARRDVSDKTLERSLAERVEHISRTSSVHGVVQRTRFVAGKTDSPPVVTIGPMDVAPPSYALRPMMDDVLGVESQPASIDEGLTDWVEDETPVVSVRLSEAGLALSDAATTLGAPRRSVLEQGDTRQDVGTLRPSVVAGAAPETRRKVGQGAQAPSSTGPVIPGQPGKRAPEARVERGGTSDFGSEPQARVTLERGITEVVSPAAAQGAARREGKAIGAGGQTRIAVDQGVSGVFAQGGLLEALIDQGVAVAQPAASGHREAVEIAASGMESLAAPLHKALSYIRIRQETPEAGLAGTVWSERPLALAGPGMEARPDIGQDHVPDTRTSSTEEADVKAVLASPASLQPDRSLQSLLRKLEPVEMGRVPERMETVGRPSRGQIKAKPQSLAGVVPQESGDVQSLAGRSALRPGVVDKVAAPVVDMRDSGASDALKSEISAQSQGPVPTKDVPAVAPSIVAGREGAPKGPDISSESRQGEAFDSHEVVTLPLREDAGPGEVVMVPLVTLQIPARGDEPIWGVDEDSEMVESEGPLMSDYAAFGSLAAYSALGAGLSMPVLEDTSSVFDGGEEADVEDAEGSLTGLEKTPDVPVVPLRTGVGRMDAPDAAIFARAHARATPEEGAAGAGFPEVGPRRDRRTHGRIAESGRPDSGERQRAGVAHVEGPRRPSSRRAPASDGRSARPRTGLAALSWLERLSGVRSTVTDSEAGERGGTESGTSRVGVSGFGVATGGAPFMPILAQAGRSQEGMPVQPAYLGLAASMSSPVPSSTPRGGEWTQPISWQGTEEVVREGDQTFLVGAGSAPLEFGSEVGHRPTTGVGPRESAVTQRYSGRAGAFSDDTLISGPGRVAPDLAGAVGPVLLKGLDMLMSSPETDVGYEVDVPGRDTLEAVSGTAMERGLLPGARQRRRYGVFGTPEAFVRGLPGGVASRGGLQHTLFDWVERGAVSAVEKLARRLDRSLPMAEEQLSSEERLALSAPLAYSSGESAPQWPYTGAERGFEEADSLRIEVLPGALARSPETGRGKTSALTEDTSSALHYLTRPDVPRSTPSGPSTWAGLTRAVESLNAAMKSRTGASAPLAADKPPVHPIPLSLLSAEPVRRDVSGVAEGVYMAPSTPPARHEAPSAKQGPEEPDVRGMEQVVAELRWRMKLQDRWENEQE